MPYYPPAASSGLTVGTTAISGGSNGNVLYDNSGVLGEQASTSYSAGSGLTLTSTTFALDTNNAGGIGSIAWLFVTSGSVNAGATISGASLSAFVGNSTNGQFANGSVTPSGTWRNISLVNLSNGGGKDNALFQRTA